jgi:hypothetical protein
VDASFYTSRRRGTPRIDEQIVERKRAGFRLFNLNSFVYGMWLFKLVSFEPAPLTQSFVGTGHAGNIARSMIVWNVSGSPMVFRFDKIVWSRWERCLVFWPIWQRRVCSSAKGALSKMG